MRESQWCLSHISSCNLHCNSYHIVFVPMQLQVSGAEVCEAVRGVLPWAHSPDHVWLHEEHHVSQLLRQDGRMGAGSHWRPLHHRCRSWPGSNSNDAVAAAACSGSSHAGPHFVEVAIWQVALLEVIQLATLLEVIQLVTLLEVIQLVICWKWFNLLLHRKWFS